MHHQCRLASEDNFERTPSDIYYGEKKPKAPKKLSLGYFSFLVFLWFFSVFNVRSIE